LKNMYTAEGFNSHYIRVSETIRKYDTLALVEFCLAYLHAPVKDQFQYLQRLPWLVLLLLKWTFLEKRAFKRGKKIPSLADFNDLLQLMHDFGKKDISRLPDQYENIRLFFRAMAYQQFIFQQPIRLTSIARQKFYFGSISPDHYIRKTFLSLVGIDIPVFLDLSQALFIKFFDEKDRRVSIDWFASIRGAFSDKEVALFLGAISKSVNEMRSALNARDKDNFDLGRPVRSPAEYWEQTPLVKFPLIKTGKSYVCVDYHVLSRCLEGYVYSRLRENDAKVFMANFGPLFENYVERTIISTGLNFVSEFDIKNWYGHGSTTVDFVLEDADANIFIDAKGVEMSYQGKSTPDSEELAKWLETSALKAIKQAHGLIQNIARVEVDQRLTLKKRNYLIAVTYSELYVGGGRTLAEAVGEARLGILTAAVAPENRIPLENMFFMTIKEFDLLAEAVRKKEISLSEMLDYAVKAGEDPKTEKFEFLQHMYSAKIKITEPDYLVEEAVSSLKALAAHLT